MCSREASANGTMPLPNGRSMTGKTARSTSRIHEANIECHVPLYHCSQAHPVVPTQLSSVDSITRVSPPFLGSCTLTKNESLTCTGVSKKKEVYPPLVEMEERFKNSEVPS